MKRLSWAFLNKNSGLTGMFSFAVYLIIGTRQSQFQLESHTANLSYMIFSDIKFTSAFDFKYSTTCSSFSKEAK